MPMPAGLRRAVQHDRSEGRAAGETAVPTAKLARPATSSPEDSESSPFSGCCMPTSTPAPNTASQWKAGPRVGSHRIHRWPACRPPSACPRPGAPLRTAARRPAEPASTPIRPRSSTSSELEQLPGDRRGDHSPGTDPGHGEGGDRYVGGADQAACKFVGGHDCQFCQGAGVSRNRHQEEKNHGADAEADQRRSQPPDMAARAHC